MDLLAEHPTIFQRLIFGDGLNQMKDYLWIMYGLASSKIISARSLIEDKVWDITDWGDLFKIILR
jgi:predicted GH43/DUF377 family glycosyl hydrolase